MEGYHQKLPVEDQSTRGNEDQEATKVDIGMRWWSVLGFKLIDFIT